MSETCEFANVDFEIEEQIIIGGNLVPRARDLQEKNQELWDNP